MKETTMSEYKERTTLNDWLTQQAVSEEELAGTHEDAEPEIDDSVKFCPECETPNQFGELCDRCRREIEAEGTDYRNGD